MTQSATKSARLPVNTTGLKERMFVRTELTHLDAQLQNFTQLRDGLVASGQDANAKYREIQTQRNRLLAKWKKLSVATSPVMNPALPGSAASSLPIAAPRLIGTDGLGPWFGYSGSVRMPMASEGEDQRPPQGAGTGSIQTLDNGLLANAGVLFTADLTASGSAAIWLHNWTYLVLFPAPVVKSVFTYSFGMGVQVSVWGGQGAATFLSFLALGETGNYTGQNLTVQNDGFPLVTALNSPISKDGLNVRRSFPVEAGQIPAVCVVVGVAIALAPDSEIMLSPYADNFICLADSIDPATALGPNAERGLMNFHYQPLPPESLP